MRHSAIAVVIGALVVSACSGPPSAEQCAARLDMGYITPRLDLSEASVVAVRAALSEPVLVSVRATDGSTTVVPADLDSADVALSPDGARLVVSTEPDRELVVIEVGSGSATPLGVTGSGPAWSPDGTSIAFVDLSGAVTVVGADGSSAVRVTDGDGRDGPPAWSPDGDRLLFPRDTLPDALGFEEILVVDVSGGDPQRLTRGPTVGAPAWSPDGTRIAYQDFDGLTVMCADGALGVAIAPDALFPVWSPDGRRLAFAAIAGDDDPGLFLIDAGGGIPDRLTDGAADFPISWTATRWP